MFSWLKISVVVLFSFSVLARKIDSVRPSALDSISFFETNHPILNKGPWFSRQYISWDGELTGGTMHWCTDALAIVSPIKGNRKVRYLLYALLQHCCCSICYFLHSQWTTFLFGLLLHTYMFLWCSGASVVGAFRCLGFTACPYVGFVS